MSAGLPPQAVRRAVIDPLWIPIAALLMLLLAVVCAISAILGLLLAPVFRRHRVLRLSTLALCYVGIDAVLVIGAFALWVRRPLRRQQDLTWRAQHAVLLGWALDALQSAARVCLGYRIDPAGLPELASEEGPLLVLARHAGPGDSFTLVSLLISRYGRLPRVVLKEALRWDPGLDIVLTRLSCYFLPSRSGAGEDRIEAVGALAAELQGRDALLLFPEGGNWTPRRHRRAVMRLFRAGHHRRAWRAKRMSRVLPVRPGGALACLQSSPEADVLVIAHCGLDTLVNPRQMWQALPLRDTQMTLHGWAHPAAAVPRDDRAALAWLDEQWAKVDSWVAEQREAVPATNEVAHA